LYCYFIASIDNINDKITSVRKIIDGSRDLYELQSAINDLHTTISAVKDSFSKLFMQYNKEYMNINAKISNQKYYMIFDHWLNPKFTWKDGNNNPITIPRLNPKIKNKLTGAIDKKVIYWYSKFPLLYRMPEI